LPQAGGHAHADVMPSNKKSHFHASVECGVKVVDIVGTNAQKMAVERAMIWSIKTPKSTFLVTECSYLRFHACFTRCVVAPSDRFS